MFGWIAFADKSAQLGNVVEALGGFILVRGWCPYRRVPAGRRLLVRHGGGVLDFLFRGPRSGGGVPERLIYHLVGRR